MKKSKLTQTQLLKEIRKAFADYVVSEGCSCCRDEDAHQESGKRLAELLNIPTYEDNSGFNFSSFRTDKNEWNRITPKYLWVFTMYWLNDFLFPTNVFCGMEQKMTMYAIVLDNKNTNLWKNKEYRIVEVKSFYGFGDRTFYVLEDII